MLKKIFNLFKKKKHESKRVEALKDLRAYVKEGKNIRFSYVEKDSSKGGDTCYCALGFLGNKYGVKDDTMIKFKEKRFGTRDTKPLSDKLKDDFELHELYKLQAANDDRESYFVHYVDNLVKVIDELIEKSA